MEPGTIIPGSDTAILKAQVRALQGQVAMLQEQVSILQGHSRALYDRVTELEEWREHLTSPYWKKTGRE